MQEIINSPLDCSEKNEFVNNVAAVQARFAQLDATSKTKRARELAALLGLTEAQWVAAQCGTDQTVALAGTAQEILAQVPSVGEVMALTRNEYCVHERHGRYQEINIEPPVGLVLGPDIDLRIFFSVWHQAWAVEENGRSSLQFFDRSGVAVHKIYCTVNTDMQAYRALVSRFASQKNVWPVPEEYAPVTEAGQLVEVRALRQAWLAMSDTHDFYPLLRRFKLARLAAIQSVGLDLAQPVASDAVELMLRAVVQNDISIMCFVGNRGLIQIHTGHVKKIQRTGSWLNILDSTFNLHLDTNKLAASWIVNKPSADGWITSLELYAESGELIVQFFGARKPGLPELVSWRALMLSFCREQLAT